MLSSLGLMASAYPLIHLGGHPLFILKYKYLICGSREYFYKELFQNTPNQEEVLHKDDKYTGAIVSQNGFEVLCYK